MGIFEEESAEDAAFWENPTGAPALPAGAEAEAVVADPATEEGGEEPSEEPPAPDEGGQEDPPADDGAGEGGEEGGEDLTAQQLAELKQRLEVYERRVSEKDEFINRQANEIGEMRKQFEQVEQRSQMGDWDEVLDNNPAQAAEMALNAGDRRRYMQAREAWEELSPGAPGNFEKSIALQRELDQVKAALEARTAPIERRQELEQVATAYTQIKERYPDFDDFEDAMGQTLDTRPLLKESLQSVLRGGTLDDQTAALEDLYLLTAGRKRDTLAEAKREADARTQAVATAQKDGAVVVTGAGSPEEVGKSIADKIAAEWDDIQSPFEEGWNV